MLEIAGVEDAEEILALQREAFRSEAELYDNPLIAPLIQTLDDIRAEFLTLIFLKYLHADGRILGSVRAGMRAGDCHIAKLMVHPACQHQGIGRILLGAIERRFASARHYCLFTGIRNPRNLRFYENAGYQVCGQSSPYPGMTLIHFQKIAGE